MDVFIEMWNGLTQLWNSIIWTAPFTGSAIFALCSLLLMLGSAKGSQQIFWVFGLLFLGFSIMSTEFQYAAQNKKQDTVSEEALDKFDAMVADFDGSFIKPDPRAQHLINKRSEMDGGEVGPRRAAFFLEKLVMTYGPILTRAEQESAYELAESCLDKIEGGNDLAPILKTYPVYHAQLQWEIAKGFSEEKQRVSIKNCEIRLTENDVFWLPGIEPKVMFPAES